MTQCRPQINSLVGTTWLPTLDHFLPVVTTPALGLPSATTFQIRITLSGPDFAPETPPAQLLASPVGFPRAPGHQQAEHWSPPLAATAGPPRIHCSAALPGCMNICTPRKHFIFFYHSLSNKPLGKQLLSAHLKTISRVPGGLTQAWCTPAVRSSVPYTQRRSHLFSPMESSSLSSRFMSPVYKASSFCRWLGQLTDVDSAWSVCISSVKKKFCGPRGLVCFLFLPILQTKV